MPRGTRRYGSSLEISTYSELEHTCNLGRKLRNNFKLDYDVQFGNLIIVDGGKLSQSYDEKQKSNYMRAENIEITIETFTGKKNFTAYTMDLTKKYIEINADYRS